MQQIQQQQILQQHQRQQAARQQMLAQQYSGMPVQMTNGMGQMTQAQFQAMRGGPMARPVNLPQHLQQAQQQVAEHSLQQQQQQQQAQAQHQVWSLSIYLPTISVLSSSFTNTCSINSS